MCLYTCTRIILFISNGLCALGSRDDNNKLMRQRVLTRPDLTGTWKSYGAKRVATSSWYYRNNLQRYRCGWVVATRARDAWSVDGRAVAAHRVHARPSSTGRRARRAGGHNHFRRFKTRPDVLLDSVGSVHVYLRIIWYVRRAGLHTICVELAAFRYLFAQAHH